jgi:hypothetical protein
MANLALADEEAGAGAGIIGDRRLLELRARLDKKGKPRIKSTARKALNFIREAGNGSSRGTDEGDEVVGLVVAEEVRVEEGPAARSRRH